VKTGKLARNSLAFVLATVVGAAFFYGEVFLTLHYDYRFLMFVHDFVERFGFENLATQTIYYGVPASAAAIGTFAIGTRIMAGKTPPTETRCRKCGYILRGLERPECSECGERI
jgi:hypothetical protein